MAKRKSITDKMAVEAKLKNMLLKVPEDHAGMSQRELANKSGISRHTLRKIESEAMDKLTQYIQQFVTEEGSD